MRALIFAIALACCGCSCGEPKQYADYSARAGFVASDSVSTRDSVSVENLEVLARVWGFAKYHHPAFADETEPMRGR